MRKTSLTKTDREIIKDVLMNMPEEKKAQLDKACEINHHLTSTWELEDVTMTAYNEGFYIEFKGTRCGFKVWVYDNDGELVVGRKPVERKLNKLWECYDKTSRDWFE